jgi:general secretion pathway protein M
MTRPLPTGRTGRLLALGLTVLVAAVLWVGFAGPLIQWHDERAEALTRRALLARRMQALVAALPSFQQEAKDVMANGVGEPALLEGDSDSMASAFLQERLRSMFMPVGVQLNSVETSPGEEAGAYRRVRLRVSFNASWPVLMGLLKDIHTTTPVLLVDELQVQPALHRISTAPGTFDVTCAIFGFRSGPTRVSTR